MLLELHGLQGSWRQLLADLGGHGLDSLVEGVNPLVGLALELSISLQLHQLLLQLPSARFL